MEKHTTTVQVAGKNYNLVSSDSPEYMKHVADVVSRQISELMLAARLPVNEAAVLTALNLADELTKSRDEANRLRRELEETVQVLHDLKTAIESVQEGMR